MKFLDAVTVAKIREMKRHRLNVRSAGAFAGSHSSLSRGFGQEFSQHRLYAPGDDTRFLDWKVYARKDRFYVKEYQEEKNLRYYLVLDCSGSMEFKSQRALFNKWEYACRMAISLACLVLLQGDLCGVLAISDGMKANVVPRSGLGQLEMLDDALAGCPPGGNSGIKEALENFLPAVKKHSVLILFSDLMIETGKASEALRMLAGTRYNASVFHVIDPAEKELPWEGAVTFEDMETGMKLACAPGALRREYSETFSRWLRLIDGTCRASGAFYQPCFTDLAQDHAIGRFIKAHSGR